MVDSGQEWGAPHPDTPWYLQLSLLSLQGSRRDLGGNCLKVRGVTPLRVSRR